jgi:halimadienyl-diphosphate synthase
MTEQGFEIETRVSQDITSLLHEIGPGQMSNTVYDTAWVARLGDVDKQLSTAALDWICEHQLPDGSWGAAVPVHYHDRLICTLAALVALTRRGRRTQDKRRIEHGLEALERIAGTATKGLMGGPKEATVGFEMIVPTLLEEAKQLGVIQNQGARILAQLSAHRERKLGMMRGQMISRHVTLAHSAEMAGPDATRLLDINNLQESNGSVANSPSATAYFALQVCPGDEAALSYLRRVANQGGVPNVAPFEVFERVWVLWNFVVTGQMTEEQTQLARPHLDYLAKIWRPHSGVGFAADYTPTDGDDTGATFELLRRFDYSPDLEAVLAYEQADRFRCFEYESDPSISANIHILAALRHAGLEITHPSVEKVVSFLQSNRVGDIFWADKWHASPYYSTAHAIIACAGYVNGLAEPAVDWIVRTQNRNGSWGYYTQPTAEETAYCLQALAIWKQTGHEVSRQTLADGAAWLKDNANLPHPALWIGKCLYTPDRVVRSTVLSALQLATLT